MSDPMTLEERLAEPFPLSEVRFKPQGVKGNRAMALAFIDARLVADRLDDVVGVAGWQDEYEVLANGGGSVVCKLSVKIDGQWVTKTDVGSISEQPDEGDRTKAAFSDALKRAAVKFGIGRYLYRLPVVWADYDPQRKQFVNTPLLPAFAVPRPKNGKGPAAAEQPAAKPKPVPPPPADDGSAGIAQFNRYIGFFQQSNTEEELRTHWMAFFALRDKWTPGQFDNAMAVKNKMKDQLTTATK